MKVTRIMVPEYILELDLSMLHLLHKMSRAHYDRTCRMLSEPTSMFTRWIKIAAWEDEMEEPISPRRVTGVQLDQIMKVCEMASAPDLLSVHEQRQVQEFTSTVQTVIKVYMEIKNHG